MNTFRCLNCNAVFVQAAWDNCPHCKNSRIIKLVDLGPNASKTYKKRLFT